MFSAKLERRRKFKRLAVLVAAATLVAGLALIAVWAVRASTLLATAQADRTPVVFGVALALGALVVLCLITYAAVRAAGRLQL